MITDPLPFANFIIARMLRRLPKGAGAARAVAETEIPIQGDDWYWADDNAKVLELLAMPSIWRTYPEAVSDIVRFVCSMCAGPLIFRRIAAPRLLVEHAQGGVGRFKHSLMNVSCNLDRGEVTLGMRFHDGRTARNAVFAGNSVRFTHGRREYTINPALTVEESAIEPYDGGVRLVWKSEIVIKKKSIISTTVRIGKLTYTYNIAASSMFVDVEAQFDISPDVDISDVILSFGCDQLSHDENGIRYEVLAGVEPDGACHSQSASPERQIDLPLRGASYWSVAQTSHMAGFAAAIHSLPREPERVTGLRAQCDEAGRLRSAVSDHRFGGAQSGRLVAGERTIITAGGFYDTPSLYARILRRESDLCDAGAPPKDLSISYDYGAEINALAQVLGALRDPRPPVGEPEASRLRARVEWTLDHLLRAFTHHFLVPARANPSLAFSRSLAYAAFGHAELFRQTGDAKHRWFVAEICTLIASFERQNVGLDDRPQSGFVMGTEVDALPYVDCHATCMLALVRGVEILNTPRWIDAIDRGLAAFCLDTQKFFFLGFQKIDVVCVDFQDSKGDRHKLETFWNFKSGLCLQLFNALKATDHPGLRAVWEKHRLRLDLLESFMRERIRRSLRYHDDGVEILSSMLSAETNSETQPWVTLGLLDQFNGGVDRLRADADTSHPR